MPPCKSTWVCATDIPTHSDDNHLPPAAETSGTAAVPLPQQPDPTSALPPDVLIDLHQALLLGDINRLGSLIEQVQGYDASLAQMLAALAEDFQYDQIFMLLKAYEQGDEGEDEPGASAVPAETAQEKTPAGDRGR